VNRFEAWLEESTSAIAVKQFPEGTRTAVDAARAIGCELGQIVKSLVFVAGGTPVVALVSGTNRLDERRLSAVAGEPVLKADAQTARSATGYAIGGVPPFGHATEVPVFMDRDLLGYEVVWAAAGRPDSVFEIAPDRLRELSNATVVDLKAAADSNPPPALDPTKSSTSRGPLSRATSPASGEGDSPE
jgi:prolyl-tRNA editing enzyme YbaK/EbsC (Cys-tRNA(Pro) deacylase)